MSGTPTTFLGDLDSSIQWCRGAVAQFQGQTFDVYRVGSNAATASVVDPLNKIATNVAASFERTTKVQDIEVNLMAKVLLFRADLDTSSYQIGDVFVERSDALRADASMYTLAFNRPLHDPVFVFTPSLATIRRPNNNPQNVDSGLAPMASQGSNADDILTLTNGVFSFAPTGTAVTVPVCVQAHERRGENSFPDTRTDDAPRVHQWDAYVPLLSGGVLIQENDAIVDAQLNTAFRVQTPFAQMFGLQGQLLQTEKKLYYG